KTEIPDCVNVTSRFLNETTVRLSNINNKPLCEESGIEHMFEIPLERYKKIMEDVACAIRSTLENSPHISAVSLCASYAAKELGEDAAKIAAEHMLVVLAEIHRMPRRIKSYNEKNSSIMYILDAVAGSTIY